MTNLETFFHGIIIEHKDNLMEMTKAITEAHKVLVEAAIDADRENVAEHAEAERDWEDDCINGGTWEVCKVNKESIINAPKLEIE